MSLKRPPYTAQTYMIPPVGALDQAPFVTINIHGRYLFVRDITGIAADVLHVQFGHFAPEMFPRKGWLSMPPLEEYDSVRLINTSLTNYAIVKVVLSLGQYGEAIVTVDNEIPPPLAPNRLSTRQSVTVDTGNNIMVEIPENLKRREILLQNRSDFPVYIAGDWNIHFPSPPALPEAFGFPIDRNHCFEIAAKATAILATSAAIYIIGNGANTSIISYLEIMYDLGPRATPPQ